jgi:NarL family two-component system response regulator LiaR
MTDSSNIRVMIVDDHPVIRSGLSAFLRVVPDLELAGEASSGHRALALLEQAAPDVILMDMMMPEMSGVEAIQAIMARNPDIRILVLTSYKEDHMIQDALKAGAMGYLLKDVSATELANAIRAAHAGKPTLSPEAAQALIDETRRAPKLGFDLTLREREVLTLLVEGKTNPEIADVLTISTATARFHVSNILSKLEVSSRTEAVAVTLQNNLLE